MTQYTRLHASQLLAAALGSADSQVALWLCGWSSHEIQCGIGCSHPQNNLWACGQPMPGGSCWNCPGYNVQNYPSLGVGVAAMVINLHNGLYSGLLSAIAASNISALSSGDTVRQSIHNWNQGPNSTAVGYESDIGNFLAEGQNHAGDLFDDSGDNNLPVPTPLDQFACVKCGPAQLECCSPMVCQNGACINPVAAAPGNAAGGIVNAILPGWLQKPDWTRFLKFLIGLILLVVGLLLALDILEGKAASNPVVQQAGKALAVAG